MSGPRQWVVVITVDEGSTPAVYGPYPAKHQATVVAEAVGVVVGEWGWYASARPITEHRLLIEEYGPLMLGIADAPVERP